LINKTNQFNLTTRRTTEDEVRALLTDPHAIALQFRLVDRLGDNGMIGVVVARETEPGTYAIETWLMSCRVLGRGVETAILAVLAEAAAGAGADHLVGRYRPTPKNAMVRGHYAGLGFTPVATEADGSETFRLSLDAYRPGPSPIVIAQG